MRLSIPKGAGADGGNITRLNRFSYQLPYAKQDARNAFRLDLAMYVEAGEEGGFAFVAIYGAQRPVLLKLARDAADAGGGYLLTLLDNNTGPLVPAVSFRIAPATWTQIRLQTSLPTPVQGGLVFDMTLTVDGTSQTTISPVMPVESSMRVEVGLATTTVTSAEWAIRYDDVLIDGVD